TALSPLRSALEDVSGDGLLDLTLKFSVADLVEHGALSPDTIEGILIGLLVDGTAIEGMDSIRIVPPNGSKGNNLQISAVPEPTTLALTALGLLGIGWRRRKRA
ncbi:MAG: PEP-CTERM sorting domain-containing protein, partial [Planctomycetes bacterium]|nr:PEP-CTERM sorting domain-containing protein [Planctomycetota bacterium]